jgi:hypothetical protein
VAVYVVVVPPDAVVTGKTLPVPGPTLVQTLAPAVASVKIYISPEVVFAQTVPTPPAGLVETVGSLALFVIPSLKPVKALPSHAGNVPAEANIELETFCVIYLFLFLNFETYFIFNKCF